MAAITTWRKVRALLISAVLVVGIYLSYVGCAAALANSARISELERAIRHFTETRGIEYKRD